jgi:uncharacterized phage protein gp47/JayE
VNEKALAILVLLLGNISSDYDKSVGSFIYDSLASVAIEMAKTDVSIAAVADKLSIANLSGSELAQRVRELTGIIRRVATNAIGTIELTGTGTINTGDLFETSGGVQFQSTESKFITVSGSVTIQSVIAGASGVVPSGTITLFPVTLAGFTTVTNASTTHDGFEAESDADLLQRYYDRVQTPATSGNKSHYLNWTKEVSGVGLAKVFPLWGGNNTVKVLIVDQNRQPASTELVETVQEYLDPEIQGLGEGAAPIGAFVTVASAAGMAIIISVTVILSSGYTLEQVEGNISESVTEYLKGIAFVETIVSYAKIGAEVLNSEGVEDYSDLILNGGTTNIPIDPEEVAVLGGVGADVA